MEVWTAGVAAIIGVCIGIWLVYDAIIDYMLIKRQGINSSYEALSTSILIREIAALVLYAQFLAIVVLTEFFPDVDGDLTVWILVTIPGIQVIASLWTRFTKRKLLSAKERRLDG